MKLTRKLLAVLVLIIGAGITAIPAFAQSQEIVTAEVDRRTISTDDILSLTVSVDKAYGNPDQPQIPPLEGFQVVGASSTTHMTIINGSMSAKTAFIYSLRPLQPGQFTIDPISVAINGQTYATQPITVKVIQGNGQPSSPNVGSPFGSLLSSIPGFSGFNFPSFGSLPSFPSLPNSGTVTSGPVVEMDPAEAPVELAGNAYYLETLVDNPNPVQGEQIVHTLRLFQPVDAVFQPEYIPPAYTGFWSQPESEQNNLSLWYGGRNYRVTELKTVLIPTVLDQLTIDGAAINIPGGFFSPAQQLTSDPIQVSVRPLPQGAPSSFSGAVGQFEISVEADTAETVVNDAVTMKLIVSGSGNIETMGDPQWPDMPGWRAFDSKASTESLIDGGQLKGRRVYERVMVPTEPGILALPSIEFTYFNPESQEYTTISTEELPFTVMGDSQSSAPASLTQAVNPQNLGTQSLNDIRPLKTSSSSWSVGDVSVSGNPVIWLIWAAPLMILGIISAWQFRQRRRHDTLDIRRSRAAQKQAIKSLSAAEGDQSDDVEQVGPIVISYLENKLNLPLTGYTSSQLRELLIARNIDKQSVDRLQNTLLLSEIGRFAPSELVGPERDLIKETKKLIKELDSLL